MKSSKIYNLLDCITFYGFSNEEMGVCKDEVSTFAYFGVRRDIRLDGEWFYIYIRLDEYDVYSRLFEDVEPDYELGDDIDGCYLLYSLE